MEIKKNYFLLDGEGGAGSEGSDAGFATGTEGNPDTEDHTDDLFDEPHDDEGMDDGDGEGDRNADGQDPGEDLTAEFDKLVKGKFKEQYESKVKTHLDKRFKNAQESRDKLTKYEDALFPLYERYDVEPGDLEALEAAISNDDGFIEDRAAEEGLTVEQYRKQKKLESENRRLTREEQRRKAVAEADQVYKQWEKEAAELKEIYPHFDLRGEAQSNEEFVTYLNSGMSVRKAYEAAHVQELLSGAIQMAVKETKKNTLAKIRNQGMRPRENGMNSKATIKVKKTAENLTDEDMKRINERVARGERISF